ncbi:MAG: YggS family pyridoxal phosphate-dependent enzyme [Chloroflexota bacterium]
MTTEAELRERIEAVMGRIARAAARAGRDSEAVTLVGVSKTMPAETVRLAYGAGLRHLGENRVQEAEAKFAEFRPGDLRLHLIGHLQRNKARKAAALFDCVHSMDSLELALALGAARAESGESLPVLVEVNVAGEESKFGVPPAEALPLIERMLAVPGLAPRGLMTIAPLVADPEAVRPFFRRLRELRDECERQLDTRLPALSMGMTNDFEVAVEEGSTLVRVGRAIFGERG